MARETKNYPPPALLTSSAKVSDLPPTAHWLVQTLLPPSPSPGSIVAYGRAPQICHFRFWGFLESSEKYFEVFGTF